MTDSEKFLEIVTHRVGDLENRILTILPITHVTHRVGDLESLIMSMLRIALVTHRVGDLEKFA